MRDEGAVLLLLLLAGGRGGRGGSITVPAPAPALPKPKPGTKEQREWLDRLPPCDDPDLCIPLQRPVPSPHPLLGTSYILDMPNPTHPADRLWARFVADPDRPGPRLNPQELSVTPHDRPPSPFERWCLRRFFPVFEDVTEARLHLGKLPSLGPDVKLPPDFATPPSVMAVTDANGEVWFPPRATSTGGKEAPVLSHFYWITILAHELAHRSQRRMGLTPGQALDAILKHGYADSPIERQARWLQQVIADALIHAADRFFALKKRAT